MSINAPFGPIEISEKPEKPIVLNQRKWNEILKHLQRGDDEKYASEADRQYKEYLQDESRAMTNKWENSLKATIKAKEEKRLECDRKKIDETAERFKQLKESDEMKRFEQNVQAMDHMQKLKMGSRLLEGAYKTSECVAVQQLQRNFNAKSEALKRELELAMGRDAVARDELYSERQKFNIIESRRKQNEYKKELRQFIENRERQQTELKNAKCEEERLERNRNENEMAMQLIEERRMLYKKKEANRIIALEAMLMAEKRRLREKQVDALENQVATIFSEGIKIDEIKKQHENELVRAKEHFYNNALVNVKNVQVNEDESIERTVDELRAKLKFKDQAKLEEKRRLKQMQIKNHLDDLAREEMRKQRRENELKRDIENRIRNEEVNFEFDRQKRLETMNRIKEHRRIIMEQMEERKQKDAEKDYSDLISLNEMNVQEDKAFFNYADELVNETIQKNRPVYPFTKVIDEYNRANVVNSNKFIYGVDELKALRPQK